MVKGENMKFKCKYLMMCLLLFSVFLSQSESVLANEKNDVLDKTSDTRRILDSVGLNSEAYDILEGEDIIIGTTQTKTYKTFKSNIDALVSISKDELIIAIKEKYQLSNLSNSNWLDYYNAAQNENEETSGKYDKITCFFDIYENEEKNTEIKQAVNNFNTSPARISNETQLNEINELLPYTSMQITLDSINRPQARVKGLSYVKMKAYADKWARSYNPAFPKYGADCTNFVSQIINAGGRKENVNWGRGMKTFKIADKFAKHFGVRMRTYSLKTFSSNIKAGDVALIDETGDGSYNHAGFVYDIGTYKKYGNKYYTDFKIAQHTKGWIAWASSSTNNWENNKGYWAIMTITQ